MPAILVALLKQVEADPSRALVVLGPFLDLFGASLVPMLAHALPAGPLRAYVDANPTDVMAFIHEELAVIAKHPALVKAAVAQFDKPAA